jgi:hypothetical protein
MAETTPENLGKIQFGRIKVFEGHTNLITSLAIKDNLIISCSGGIKLLRFGT